MIKPYHANWKKQGDGMKTNQKSAETHQRHVEILASKGFVPPSLIHAVVGSSRAQWCRDARKFREAGNPPPLRVNTVTGKEGYFYQEFVEWFKSTTEIRA